MTPVHYVLDPAPPAFRYLWPWVVFLVLVPMAGTTLAYLMEERHHKLAAIARVAKRLRDACWVLAMVGLILIGLRVGDAQLPLVRSRIVLYAVAVAYLAMAIWFGYYSAVVAPRLDAAHQEKLLRRQYLRSSRRKR
ncbi:MAG TPA: hypothetical protein VMV93_11600 [Chloroflexota bacterium]|nr:hypothetical protein [Chloroflexota bacterium]